MLAFSKAETKKDKATSQPKRHIADVRGKDNSFLMKVWKYQAHKTGPNASFTVRHPYAKSATRACLLCQNREISIIKVTKNTKVGQISQREFSAGEVLTAIYPPANAEELQIASTVESSWYFDEQNGGVNSIETAIMLKSWKKAITKLKS